MYPVVLLILSSSFSYSCPNYTYHFNGLKHIQCCFNDSYSILFPEEWHTENETLQLQTLTCCKAEHQRNQFLRSAAYFVRKLFEANVNYSVTFESSGVLTCVRRSAVLPEVNAFPQTLHVSKHYFIKIRKHSFHILHSLFFSTLCNSKVHNLLNKPRTIPEPKMSRQPQDST
jgi:hypothetical protein